MTLAINVGTGAILKQAGTAVGQVTKIEISGYQASEIKIDNLGSTTLDTRPGLVDAGSIKASIQFDPANQASLNASLVAGTVETWLVQFPDGASTTFACSGWIKSLSVSGLEVDAVIMAELEIKLTGAWTIA
jgi:hypothetical protein